MTVIHRFAVKGLCIALMLVISSLPNATLLPYRGSRGETLLTPAPQTVNDSKPLDQGDTARPVENYIERDLAKTQADAEQGNADAQFRLGSMYDLGVGVARDYKLALAWYTKAAEQGNGDAQSALGYLYYEGRGTPQDYKQAYAWSSLAAANEKIEAIHNRNEAASKLSPAELEEAQKMAAELAQQIEKNQADKK